MTDAPPRVTPCRWICAHPELDPVCLADHPAPIGCATCADYEQGLNDVERTRCEVWTRVMGYHRPVAAFNPGKQEEHRGRRLFAEPADGGDLPARYPFPVGQAGE